MVIRMRKTVLYSDRKASSNEGHNLHFSTLFIKCTARSLSFRFWKVVAQISYNPEIKGIELNLKCFILFVSSKPFEKKFLRISKLWAWLRQGSVPLQDVLQKPEVYSHHNRHTQNAQKAVDARFVQRNKTIWPSCRKLRRETDEQR